MIHFDIDAAEVGKIREADIPVVGPLKLALSQLTRDVKALEAEKRTDRTAWHAQLEEWRALYPYKYRRAEGVLKPQTVIERLRDLTGEREGDVIWTTGVGQHQMWAMQYLVSATSRARSSPRAASGRWATACRPRSARRRRGPTRPSICVDGDGCFQMTCQELATAALERLPIVVVIINNGWLGMVRQWQELFYAERYAETHLTKQVPDYAQLAEALGGAGFMVDNEDDLDVDARGGARLRPHRRRRRPRRPGRELLPDGAGRAPPRSTCIELPDEDERCRRGSSDEPSHRLRRAREQARCARARVADVRAARLQHPEPRRRARPSGPDISRLTLRVDCSEHSLEQIEKQMHKLVNVLRVVELRPGESVERELALITVGAPPDKRSELIALGEVFGARVADIGREALTFEIVGRPEELDAFEELVRPHGVRELARTGRIGLRRPGPRPARHTAAAVS